MTRTIEYGSLRGQSASQFSSRLFSASLQTGYTFRRKETLLIEPNLVLTYSHLTQDAFTESGGSGLDLDVREQTVPSWNSNIGARLKYLFGHDDLDRGFVAFSVAWAHEWSTTENTLSARFADVNGGSHYSVEATPRDRNAAAFGLHGNFPMKGPFALVTDYSARLTSTETTQWVFGGGQWKW